MKRIFITGGASGLGKAIALKYAREGYQVCIGDVNDERGQQTLNELQALGSKNSNDACYLPCNVSHYEDIENICHTLTTHWGGVDIVVNNAGVGGTAGPIDEVPLADWDWVLDINLHGVIRGVRAFTPLFKQQKSGYFVNIASAAGLFGPPNMSGYAVAKAGVIALSESMQAELSAFNIGTTVVCPAFFATNLLENMKSTVDGVHEITSRRMEKSDINADDIAEMIFRAVREQAFMLQPHQIVQQQWQFKRAKPEEFAKYMRVEGQKLITRHLP